MNYYKLTVTYCTILHNRNNGCIYEFEVHNRNNGLIFHLFIIFTASMPLPLMTRQIPGDKDAPSHSPHNFLMSIGANGSLRDPQPFFPFLEICHIRVYHCASCGRNSRAVGFILIPLNLVLSHAP